MISDLPPKENCPHLVEVVTDPRKFSTFIACAELPDFSSTKVSLVTVSGTNNPGTLSDSNGSQFVLGTSKLG